jgi:hypothetical protein
MFFFHLTNPACLGGVKCCEDFKNGCHSSRDGVHLICPKNMPHLYCFFDTLSVKSKSRFFLVYILFVRNSVDLKLKKDIFSKIKVSSTNVHCITNIFLAYFLLKVPASCYLPLKGLSHEIDFDNVDKKFTDVCFNKCRSCFLNFRRHR